MTTPLEHLKSDLLSKISPERTTLVRNTFLAGAALSTGILVALTQVGAKELALQVAVAACAVASPIFLCLAAVLEAYLHLGSDMNAQLLVLRSSRLYGLLQLIAGLALYVALCGIVAFLVHWALYIFLAASLVGVVYVMATYVQVVKLLLVCSAHKTPPTEEK